MALDRTWYNSLVDDDGSGLTGSVWDKADVDALMDAIDSELLRLDNKMGLWLGHTMTRTADVGLWTGGSATMAYRVLSDETVDITIAIEASQLSNGPATGLGISIPLTARQLGTGPYGTMVDLFVADHHEAGYLQTNAFGKTAMINRLNNQAFPATCNPLYVRGQMMYRFSYD